MNKEQFYKQYISTIPNFPSEGVMFRDITPTLENGEAFKSAINDFVKIASQYEFDKIICADARGFLFGAALGYELEKGIICARKPGKLPRPGLSASYSLEYGQNTLFISEGSIKKGEKVLIVDDLLATGGSASALIELINKSEATPVSAIFYIELPDLKGRSVIKKVSDIPVHSLISFEGE